MDPPRLLKISSPLGDNALVITGLQVSEQLGLPYTISVEVLGKDPNLAPNSLLTKAMTVTVSQRADGKAVERFFHGLVVQLDRLGPGAGGRTIYRLVAVPGIWRLGLKSNCRIFQEKTVKEIVETILAEHDQPAPNWGILPSLQPIPYCTQFNETDLHFVSRLLEEHGMTFYFTHAKTSHTLCISATSPGFPSFAGDNVSATHSLTDYFSSERMASH